RRNPRPARAFSTRTRAYVPKYGAGRWRRTVAWISFSSRVDVGVATPAPAISGTDDMARSPNLVHELVHGFADTLQPARLRNRQIREGDVPPLGRHLVLGEVVLRLRTADARPAFPGRVDDVEIVRNLGREVVDVRVPVAVIGGGEEEL